LSLQNTAATGKLISMPELPDIVAYIGALESRVLGQPLQRMRLASPFLLRTSQPPLASVEGRYRPRTAARWQAYSI
jgi:formamidopyrimidine-DNA glycosylase